jgi:hypothetical protein
VERWLSENATPLSTTSYGGRLFRIVRR